MKISRMCCLSCLACFAVLFAACTDLKIRKLSISPTCTPTAKMDILFTAEVHNAGPRSAGTNTLAFKVDGETVPAFYRIPRLESGQTFIVQRKSLLGVAQNYQNTITVDVNNSVKETNEDNNEAKQYFTAAQVPDTTGLVDYTYTLEVATTVRGILIDETASQKLNVKPGYYHINEFVHNYEGYVRTLSIEKYFRAVPPARSDQWVFSLIERDEITNQGACDRGRIFSGKDFYGHSFKYEIKWDCEAKCWKVLSATLDCAQVGLSAQSSAAGLATCGWSSESAWTIP